MRVGFVVYGHLGNTSGGFLYDRELVAYLRDRGDDVEVISLPWRTYRRHLGDNLSPGVYRKLRGEYDVLLQDELCHPSLILPNRRLDRDYPIVSIVHSAKTAETRSSRWHWLFRVIERQYLTSVDGVVSNSGATSETVDRLADVPGIVAPPGRGHRSPDVSDGEIAARARGPFGSPLSATSFPGRAFTRSSTASPASRRGRGGSRSSGAGRRIAGTPRGSVERSTASVSGTR